MITVYQVGIDERIVQCNQLLIHSMKSMLVKLICKNWHKHKIDLKLFFPGAVWVVGLPLDIELPYIHESSAFVNLDNFNRN